MSQQHYIFKTTTDVPSETCPGVVITVRRMTEDRRDKLRFALVDSLNKLKHLEEEFETLEGKTEPADVERRAAINLQRSVIVNIEMPSIRILWAVKVIKGLYIDDLETVGTVEDWKYWPSELFSEVANIVDHATGLAPEETKNSPLPTTSGEAVDGQMSDTAAPLVEPSASTPAAIAADTTQTA